MSRPHCPECGSVFFHRDNIGRVLCEEGHVLQGFVQESQERHVNTAAAQRLRKARKNKRKREKEASKRFKGKQAQFLLFEVAQILLQRQLQALIAHYNLPLQLETIGRDLWATYVSASNLPSPITVTPPGLDQDTSSPDASDTDTGTGTVTDTGSGTDDDTDDDFDIDQVLPRPKPARRHNPHQTQTQMDESESQRARQKKGYVTDPTKQFHTLYTLVICYLSCVTMRVPIFVHDLFKLVEEYKVPYLNFAHDLDASFRAVIPQHVLVQLLPKQTPVMVAQYGDRSGFIAWINRFVDLYATYGITFPTINYTPLLWRTTQRILLPPIFYHAAKTLLARLDVDLTFDANPAPGDRVRKSTKRGDQNGSSPETTWLVPDVLIAASVVVACKMVYGLDGHERRCATVKEAVSGLPSAQKWLEAIRKVEALPKPHDVAHLKSKPVLEYTDEDMDGFLKFAQDCLPTTFRQPKHVDFIERQYPFPNPSFHEPFDPVAAQTKHDQAVTDICRELYHDAHPEHKMDMFDPEQDDQAPVSGQQFARYASRFANDDALPFHPDMALILHVMGDLVGVNKQVMNKVARELEIRLSKVTFDNDFWFVHAQTEDTT